MMVIITTLSLTQLEVESFGRVDRFMLQQKSRQPLNLIQIHKRLKKTHFEIQKMLVEFYQV